MLVEDTLARVPLFSQLSRRDLKRLAGAVVTRHHEKGEVIVREGDDAVAFHVLTSGRVQVVKGLGGARQKVLATLGPGEFFGEMGLLDSFPRSASVVALEDTGCLVLSRWDFLAELRMHPHIAVQMLPVLSRRLRAAQGEGSY